MNHLYICKSNTQGKGLASKKDIKKGELIGIIKGPIKIIKGHFPKAVQKKSMDWIGAGRYSWIDTKNSPFRFINHSCNPNAVVTSTRTVRALRNIKAHEEIFMDYSLTEADPDWEIPGVCQCKSKNCRKKIGPIYSLPESIFNKYEPITQKKFRKVYSVGRLF